MQIHSSGKITFLGKWLDGVNENLFYDFTIFSDFLGMDCARFPISLRKQYMN